MQFTDVQLIPILGAGSKVESQETVTASNRDQFMISYMHPSCSALMSIAKTDTPSIYAPPVGWHVVYALDPKGNEVDLWIQPGGKVWRLDNCVGTGGGGATGKNFPRPGGPVLVDENKGSGWVIIALVAMLGLGWYITKDDKK